jgi:hypothetical protein
MVYFNLNSSFKPKVIHGIVQHVPGEVGDMLYLQATVPQELGIVAINTASSSFEGIIKERD